MAISLSACATPHWTNLSKQCKFGGQSVRALPVRIITVGKKRSPGVQLLVDGYLDKIRNYGPVDDVLIRSNPKNARDVKAQVDDEVMAVMIHIRSDDWVVMLDEHGLDIGSERFAELVGDAGSKVMEYSEGAEVPSLDISLNLNHSISRTHKQYMQRKAWFGHLDLCFKHSVVKCDCVEWSWIFKLLNMNRRIFKIRHINTEGNRDTKWSVKRGTYCFQFNPVKYYESMVDMSCAM